LIGSLVFAVAIQLTATQQVAIISLIIFFIVGLLLLSHVNVNQTMAEVKEDLAGVDQ
jgi:UMF1 family MFS transporter